MAKKKEDEKKKKSLALAIEQEQRERERERAEKLAKEEEEKKEQIKVKADRGDSLTTLARKALEEDQADLTPEQKVYAEDYLAKQKGYSPNVEIGQEETFDRQTLEEAKQKAKELQPEQTKNLEPYAKRAGFYGEQDPVKMYEEDVLGGPIPSDEEIEKNNLLEDTKPPEVRQLEEQTGIDIPESEKEIKEAQMTPEEKQKRLLKQLGVTDEVMKVAKARKNLMNKIGVTDEVINLAKNKRKEQAKKRLEELEAEQRELEKTDTFGEALIQEGKEVGQKIRKFEQATQDFTKTPGIREIATTAIKSQGDPKEMAKRVAEGRFDEVYETGMEAGELPMAWTGGEQLTEGAYKSLKVNLGSEYADLAEKATGGTLTEEEKNRLEELQDLPSTRQIFADAGEVALNFVSVGGGKYAVKGGGKAIKGLVKPFMKEGAKLGGEAIIESGLETLQADQMTTKNFLDNLGINVAGNVILSGSALGLMKVFSGKGVKDSPMYKQMIKDGVPEDEAEEVVKKTAEQKLKADIGYEGGKEYAKKIKEGVPKERAMAESLSKVEQGELSKFSPTEVKKLTEKRQQELIDEGKTVEQAKKEAYDDIQEPEKRVLEKSEQKELAKRKNEIHPETLDEQAVDIEEDLIESRAKMIEKIEGLPPKQAREEAFNQLKTYEQKVLNAKKEKDLLDRQGEPYEVTPQGVQKLEGEKLVDHYEKQAVQISRQTGADVEQVKKDIYDNLPPAKRAEVDAVESDKLATEQMKADETKLESEIEKEIGGEKPETKLEDRLDIPKKDVKDYEKEMGTSLEEYYNKYVKKGGEYSEDFEFNMNQKKESLKEYKETLSEWEKDLKESKKLHGKKTGDKTLDGKEITYDKGKSIRREERKIKEYKGIIERAEKQINIDNKLKELSDRGKGSTTKPETKTAKPKKTAQLTDSIQKVPKEEIDEAGMSLDDYLGSRRGEAKARKSDTSDTQDNLASEIQKAKAEGKGFEDFVEENIDSYVKNTKEYKDWAKGANNIIEGYHGTPYSFDEFEIGKKQAGAYDLQGISFSTTKENAEPFSRQFSDKYYKDYSKIKEKYLKEAEKNKKTLTKKENTLLKKELSRVTNLDFNDFDKLLTKNEAEVLFNFRKKEVNKLEGEAKDIFEKLVFGNKQKEKELNDLFNKEIKKLEKNQPKGNIYKAYIKGNKIQKEIGEEIGFGSTREGIVGQLNGDILRIKNADTGQYIGDEIIVNDPSQIFIVNKNKTKDELKEMWNNAEAKYRQGDTQTPQFTPEQTQKLKDLNKNIFGDENINIVENIMTPEGQKALGKYKQGMIDIVDGKADSKDTFYHEAVHKYFDKFTVYDEQKTMLMEAKKQFKSKTWQEAEEQLAENFIKYAQSREGVVGKLKARFDNVLERVKSYFGNEDKIKKFYSEISTGKAKKKQAELKKIAKEESDIKEATGLGANEYKDMFGDIKIDKDKLPVVSKKGKKPIEYSDQNLPDLTTRKARKEFKKEFKKSFNKWVNKRNVADTKGIKKAIKFTKLDLEDSGKIIEAMENPKIKLDGKAKAYKDRLKSEYDKLYQEAQEYGVDMGYVDDYITHIWRETPDEVSKVAVKGLGQGFKFSKGRTLPTYEEGIALGLTPRYDNPAQILGEYVRNIEKAKANIDAFRDFQKKGVVIEAEMARDLEGYEPITAKGFPGKVGDWYAPAEVADDINRIFKPQLDTFSKKAMNLGARISSTFQDISMSGGIPKTPANAWTFAQMTKEAISGRVKSPVASFVRAISEKRSNKFFQKNIKSIEEMQKNGIQVKTSLTIDSLLNDKIKKKFGDKVKEAWSKTMNEPTFKRFYPMLQVNLYNDMNKKLAKKYSKEKASRIATDTVKKFYGITEAGKIAGREKIVDDAITTMFFAPKYRESMINFWMNNLKSLNVKNPNYKMNRRFMVGAALTYAAYDWANYESTGRHMYENPEWMKDKILIDLGDGNVMGIPYLSSIATMPRYLAGIIGALTKGDMEGAAKKGFQGFSSMWIKPMAELSLNEDYFGSEIYTDTDLPKEKLQKQGIHLLKQYSGHPYIKTAIDSFGEKKAYELAGKAMEAPIRFYSKDRVENGLKYMARNEAVNIYKEMKENNNAYDSSIEKLKYKDKGLYYAIKSEKTYDELGLTEKEKLFGRELWKVTPYDQEKRVSEYLNKIEDPLERGKARERIIEAGVLPGFVKSPMQRLNESQTEQALARRQAGEELAPYERELLKKYDTEKEAIGKSEELGSLSFAEKEKAIKNIENEELREEVKGLVREQNNQIMTAKLEQYNGLLKKGSVKEANKIISGMSEEEEEVFKKLKRDDIQGEDEKRTAESYNDYLSELPEESRQKEIENLVKTKTITRDDSLELAKTNEDFKSYIDSQKYDDLESQYRSAKANIEYEKIKDLSDSQKRARIKTIYKSDKNFANALDKRYTADKYNLDEEETKIMRGSYDDRAEVMAKKMETMSDSEKKAYLNKMTKAGIVPTGLTRKGNYSKYQAKKRADFLKKLKKERLSLNN